MGFHGHCVTSPGTVGPCVKVVTYVQQGLQRNFGFCSYEYLFHQL